MKDLGKKSTTAQNLVVFLELEKVYMPFRQAVGKIAMEHSMNPYDVLVNYLDACLQDEKQRKAEADKKVSSVAEELAKAAGVRMEDILAGNPIAVNAENIDDVLAVMKRLEKEMAEDDDDDENEELDF